MKHLSCLLAALITIAFSLSAYSNPGTWMPEPKKISQIIVEDGGADGSALIIIDGGVPPAYIPAGCGSGGNSVYNTVYLNTDKGKSMYALALAAYMGGKPVKLALSCTGARPLITHILF